MIVAIIEKYPTNINYSELFEFEFEIFSLVESKQAKVLVKDVTLEIDYEDYDYVVLVGAEPLKMIGKRTGITEFQGILFNEKYISMANPAMLAFRPEAKTGIDKAVKDINEIITGETKTKIKLDLKGLQNSDDILHALRDCYIEADTYIAVDTETTSLHPRDGYVLGISITWEENQGIYFDCDYITEEIEEALQILFNKYTCIFHNYKFDKKFLMYHFGFKFPKVEDTMILHYVLDEREGTHGLKALTMKYTEHGDYERDLEVFKTEYCRSHKVKKADFTYDLIPFETMYPYACTDTIVTYELFFKFQEYLKNDPKLYELYYEIMMPGIEFLIKIEENGVPFSKEKLAVASIELDKQILELETKLYNFEEINLLEAEQGKKFNFNSTPQLRKLFFEILELKPIKKTDTGAWSTDAETLEELSKVHDLPALVMQIRKAKKIKSTYIDKIVIGIDIDSRLRTGYNLTTTTSGRLSSSGKLNMQQLPRDNKVVKDCIAARPGYLIVSQDLQTAEMYVAALLSGDRKLKAVFESGEDFHGSIAKIAFNLPCSPDEVGALFKEKRQAAKAISFGILYGSGPAKVAEVVGCTVEEAKRLISDYFGKFPQLKKWLKDSQGFIKANGYIYSALGRKRRLRNITSSDRGIVGHEVRSGVNFLIQSVASDINLLAAIDLQNWIEEKGYEKECLIFGLVHDSILAEVHESVLDEYTYQLKYFTQLDRGFNIPNCPIGVDLEIGSTYAFKD